MDIASWLSIGTLVIAALGLVLVVSQLQEQKRAMRAEFGNLYVQRYWSIDDDLHREGPGTAMYLTHQRRYLRLFEDEFEVARLGFLDGRQWAVWHGVLDSQPSRLQVLSALGECDSGKAEFERLRRCLEQREREGSPHDISRCDAR